MAVGRGNPPQHTRFRKGMSGNPNGRPRGSKNLSTYLIEAARDQVSANIGGKSRKISKIHATAMQLATKAASGNQQAINKFLDWMDEIESRAAAARPAQYPLSEPDIEVIHAIYERMKQCEPEEGMK
jgi:hypothetical protein